MPKQRKTQKIWVLNVEQSTWDNDTYAVTVTKRQVDKLPAWVRSAGPRWFGEANTRHVGTFIEAKDELQAMARFYKLWAALKSIEE
jgi:hypothetical protein